MGEQVKQQEVLKLYPNRNDGKIPFYSRIGTKLIVGFLIIAAITGTVGYLSLIGTLNEKQLKAMKMIHKSTSKLEMLINDIGRLKLNKKSIGVVRLVQENVAELEPLTEDKQIEFKAEIIPPSDKVNVLCDQKRIEQVISNLVKNSVDFVPKNGGRITIRAETDESTQNVIFTVEDNGIGIPVDKMDNLFKTFYQVDTTLTRKHGGTGLGLVICKGIIKSHGGKLWIDRNYIGGTSIRFTLPIASSENL